MSESYVRTPQREVTIPQTFGEEPSLRLIGDCVIASEWNHPAEDILAKVDQCEQDEDATWDDVLPKHPWFSVNVFHSHVDCKGNGVNVKRYQGEMQNPPLLRGIHAKGNLSVVPSDIPT